MQETRAFLEQAREGRAARPAGPRAVVARVTRRYLLEADSGQQAVDGFGSGAGLILLELEAPRLARTIRPGQFVRVRKGQQAQPFHVATRWEGGIGLLVRPGWGISTQVASLKPGARLEVIGPLGRPFDPVKGRPVWHLAGSGRLHALLLASNEANEAAAPTRLSEVGRPEPPPWWPPGDRAGKEADRSGGRVEWLPLRDLADLEVRLAGLPPEGRPILRAAGSMTFLAAIARIAERYRVLLQVALEQPMPCGVGVCLGCVVPRRGGDGASRWARSCQEGPVFDAGELDWDRLAGSPPARASAPARGSVKGLVTVEERTHHGVAAEERLPDGPLNVRLGETWLRNPLMPASGCFGYGREMASFYPLRLLGAVVTKGISLQPWEGHPTPRVAWAGGGLLNAIGLQNPGVEHFLREELPFLVEQGAAVVVNVVGRSVAEYAAVAARLQDAPRFPEGGGSGGHAAARPYVPGHGGLVALELNISCPNVDAGGLHFGQDPAAAAAVVRAVQSASSLPLWVKLSPQTPVSQVARAVVEAGAQVLSVANTLPALALDPRSGRPRVAAGSGGLSGSPLKPVNLALVQRLFRELQVPIVGIGGIRSVEDVLEYRQAGATAVAVGSAHFSDPYVLLRLRRDLRREVEAWRAAGRTEETGRWEDGRQR